MRGFKADEHGRCVRASFDLRTINRMCSLLQSVWSRWEEVRVREMVSPPWSKDDLDREYDLNTHLYTRKCYFLAP